MKVAVLFARRDSVYKEMPGCDVFDADRDARTYGGGKPVIAHPPCAQWGRLRTFARENIAEKQLSLLAIDFVRKWGGVIEHPAGSRLWDVAALPKPGHVGPGFTLVIDQLWFGHRCTKRTWLWVYGMFPSQVPEIPFSLGYPSRSIATRQRAPKRLPEVGKAERERTPPQLAAWLWTVASRCHVSRSCRLAYTEETA